MQPNGNWHGKQTDWRPSVVLSIEAELNSCYCDDISRWRPYVMPIKRNGIPFLHYDDAVAQISDLFRVCFSVTIVDHPVFKRLTSYSRFSCARSMKYMIHDYLVRPTCIASYIECHVLSRSFISGNSLCRLWWPRQHWNVVVEPLLYIFCSNVSCWSSRHTTSHAGSVTLLFLSRSFILKFLLGRKPTHELNRYAAFGMIFPALMKP